MLQIFSKMDKTFISFESFGDFSCSLPPLMLATLPFVDLQFSSKAEVEAEKEIFDSKLTTAV